LVHVTGGWLEHEIRSFPQVLACSITDDDIVVLVHPSADPVAVERSISELLRSRNIDRPVRVFGGARPVFVEPVRIRNGRTALLGTFGGAIALAAGVWLAGSGVGLRGGPTGSKGRIAHELVLAPPVVREVVTVPPSSGGEEPATEKPPPKPILRPASRGPILSPPEPPVPGPPVVEPPVVVEPPPPPVGEPPPVVEPDDDEDGDEKNGKGHCDHGNGLGLGHTIGHDDDCDDDDDD
jgi:hypothetical protein